MAGRAELWAIYEEGGVQVSGPGHSSDEQKRLAYTTTSQFSFLQCWKGMQG